MMLLLVGLAQGLDPRLMAADQRISMLVEAERGHASTLARLDVQIAAARSAAQDARTRLTRRVRALARRRGDLGGHGHLARMAARTDRQLMERWRGESLALENLFVQAKREGEALAEATEAAQRVRASIARPPPRAAPLQPPVSARPVRLGDGIQYAFAHATEVRAAGAGIVTFSDWLASYGQVVILDHGGDMATVYAHLSARMTRTGERVAAGQVLGSSETRLYFELRRGGRPSPPQWP
jgi:murein DD-endopeptidase MepM/ murein hydrolase activator NlpD